MSNFVIDSSFWIEMFTDGQLSKKCEKHFNAVKIKIVPTLVLFEVFKKISQKVNENDALLAIGNMSRHEVRNLDRSTSLLAAEISLEYKLAMADSIVLAHARIEHGTLYTLDNDFAGIDGVVVVRK